MRPEDFHDRRPGRGYTDADIHPKVAEGIIEATRRQAAQDHESPLEQTHVVEIKRNPGYKPGYPTFAEHMQSRGLDPDPLKSGPGWTNAARDYDYGARASHTITFSYHHPEYTGGRALYGVNMHEEIPPSLWAD